MDIADDWFVGFQTELKARFWHAAAEPFADAEAKAIAGLLELPAGARVLDAPCGGGRIAVRLAERGLDVLGIDISEVGYLPHDGTIEHLASMRRALRTGGRLVLESMTVAESLLPEFRSELEYRAGGVTMRARHRYDPRHSRLLGDFEFWDDEGEFERAPVIHHVYSVGEVVRLLEAGGFGVHELLGDPVEGGPYVLGSPRLVVLASAP